MLRLLGCMAVLVAVASVAPAAWGDSGSPNYRSKLLSVRPTTKGLTVRVVDGDDAIELRNSTGRNVLVPGYEGEPYLRFLVSGRVEVNVNSPAKYLNEERYGAVTVPKEASAKAKPQWQLIAQGGRYVWHEHRIHWMSTEPPPRIKQSGGNTLMKVFDWTVPLKVGVRPVKVSGTLWWVPTGQIERADALIAAALAKASKERDAATPPPAPTTTETTVTAPATETEPQALPASDAKSDSSSPVLLVVIAVLVLALLAAGAYVLQLRRRDSPAPKGEVW
jgi:hypothetical protein